MACLQPCTLPFGLDGRLWEGMGVVPVTVYGGEKWGGVVGGNGQAGGIVVDGGGELAVRCHNVCDNDIHMVAIASYVDSG
jgi:hypothetical protein